MTTPTISLDLAAGRRIVLASIAGLPREVGGILIGYREGERIVVKAAVEVDSRNSGTHHYIQNHEDAVEALRKYRSTLHPEDISGYVGEWHSHPQPSEPSPKDLATMRATFKASAGNPIALIVCAPDADDHRFHGVVFKKGRFGRVSVIPAEPRTPSADVFPAAAQPLPDGAVNANGPLFVSYRQSDGTDRSTEMAWLLRAAGFKVWHDRTDLRSGNTVDRLERALTAGLSGAMLLVTKQIEKSWVVKNVELPRLLQLDELAGFTLAIANEIEDPSNADRPDFSAPDRLLGQTPNTLGDKKQSNSRTIEGRLEIVHDHLADHISRRSHHVAGGTFVIDVQTRPASTAQPSREADLHIRLRPPVDGRLPHSDGLKDLALTLPLISDAVHHSRAKTIRIQGGMHLTVALALGMALPDTKFGHAEIEDVRESVWTNDVHAMPNDREMNEKVISQLVELTDGAANKVYVSVELQRPTSEGAFLRAVAAAGALSGAVQLSLSGSGFVEAAEGARIAEIIAEKIKQFSATHDNAEVHLFFHGPMTLAFLVGRLLNTLNVVAYEWDQPGFGAPARYVSSMSLNAGGAGGPIMAVHL
ncbi:SAVED domain-containing protein [Salinibacterium sp. M195]|uniref:SAVED domain-containing protein n=1 Tax=Salinibacterium sp. M195 TaxID=2583374 RepID=UPI00210333D7|nr:SAVED domain-containing protein [Salinibacterium sp. M195]QYH36943.1 SAVED domain-containing protein [Salinibacterium sp. M195]